MRVLDSTVHYEESGAGSAFVFLHGNPASSHMWRNVLPHVGAGRLAPDLVGMGRSGKPDIRYAFADHVLDAWLAASTDVPKLLMTFEGSPTLLIDKDLADWCATNIAALEIVHCGQAGHHAAEDRPEEIAAAISNWVGHHRLR
jgi:pimeloyl-ACP methyl ester carboxylesterase